MSSTDATPVTIDPAIAGGVRVTRVPKKASKQAPKKASKQAPKKASKKAPRRRQREHTTFSTSMIAKIIRHYNGEANLRVQTTKSDGALGCAEYIAELADACLRKCIEKATIHPKNTKTASVTGKPKLRASAILMSMSSINTSESVRDAAIKDALSEDGSVCGTETRPKHNDRGRRTRTSLVRPSLLLKAYGLIGMQVDEKESKNSPPSEAYICNILHVLPDAESRKVLNGNGKAERINVAGAVIALGTFIVSVIIREFLDAVFHDDSSLKGLKVMTRAMVEAVARGTFVPANGILASNAPVRQPAVALVGPKRGTMIRIAAPGKKVQQCKRGVACIRGAKASNKPKKARKK
jgi:hypothetical protein